MSTLLSAVARDIWDRINAVRAEASLGRPAWSELLALVATEHSRAMAEHRFFSHNSPLPGQATVVERVRNAGGRFDHIGENLAMLHTSQSTAAAFVEGWLASPLHRANIMVQEWDITGVGLWADEAGQNFATQIFGVAPGLLLDSPHLEVTRQVLFLVKLSAQVGPGRALGVFVANRFTASVASSEDGLAQIEVEIPSQPGRYHLGFGYRPAGSDDPWIGFYEGIAEIRDDERAVWHVGQPAPGNFVVTDEGLFRLDRELLTASFSGHAKDQTLVVVDGTLQSTLSGAAPFAVTHSVPARSGRHVIHFGRLADAAQYLILRSFEFNADTGTLTEFTV